MIHMTDIFEAIKAGDAAALKSILSKDPAQARATNENGDSAVLLSIYHGRKEMTELLLPHVQLNLFEASAAGKLQRVRAFSEINVFSHDGFTPLHLAAFFGHAGVVEDLLSRRADPNAVSRNRTFARGVRPLHSAVVGGCIAIVKKLLDGGADINAGDADGNTALTNAAANGNLDLVRLLVDRGALVNARTNLGETALAMAAKKNQTAVAEWLKQRSATL
jgi:ankyrin repeat protein